jgi:hypothetical protein
MRLSVLLPAIWLIAEPVGVPPPPKALVVRDYMIGEGWGCAFVVADQQSAWQCWRTPEIGHGLISEPPAAVGAWRVPWREGTTMTPGPDRVCAMDGSQVRCRDQSQSSVGGWRDEVPPKRPSGRRAAAAVAKSRDFHDDSALYAGLVGGTFACPSRKGDIWCSGDNSFGQLGYSGKPAGHPTVLGLRVTEHVGLGIWHGCAWKGGGSPASGSLFCWGRGDAGQLGVTPPDVCRVDGKDVPCARKPIRVPFDFQLPERGFASNRGKGDLRGGDLFTCARPAGKPAPGIVCWGASRDGLFGSASLCPSGLVRAWPTRQPDAVISAPRATCSQAPVPIPGSDRFKTDNFDIGPRGICMVSEQGELWCKGAIPAPSKLAVDSVVVSAGENASACARAKDGRLYCWGQGYSPGNALNRPVAITFEAFPAPPAHNPNPAPVDTPSRGDPWGKTCGIHRTCERVARTLTPCPAGVAGIIDAAALALPADGRNVSVQGPLGIGTLLQTRVGCSEPDPLSGEPLPVTACCNYRGGPIVLGDRKRLAIEGFACKGDESRLCCDLNVHDQIVVAKGRLLPYQDSPHQSSPVYTLKDATLCTVPPASGDRGNRGTP